MQALPITLGRSHSNVRRKGNGGLRASAREQSPVAEAMPVADGPVTDGPVTDGRDGPRLSVIVERQRRELTRVKADGQAAVTVAVARGVLMERHGWSLAEAARHLADMAAAAGLPETELAAAVLAQEPPSELAPESAVPGQAPAGQVQSDQVKSAPVGPDAVQAGPMEWIEAGRVLGPADSPVAIAAAERARDGAELVGALAAQLRARFGPMAVAVWLLDADGALNLFGADGLSGAESSRWQRLPPQFDCPEQRVAATEADLWWPAGVPVDDRVPAASPWGSGAARAVLALRDRTGTLLGVTEAWWPAPRDVFDVSTRAAVAAALAGFTDVLALRLAYGPVGSTAPALAVFRALDQVTESVLVVRPLWDAEGALTDFGLVHMSPGYVDPAGRPAAELAGLTLLEAYPASATGDALFAMAERILASGRPEHLTGPVGTALTGTASLTGQGDAVQVAGVHAIPFFAGVAFSWRPVGEAERLGDLLDHVQRLGRIGAWEESLATEEVRWTDSAFAVFGLDPRHAVPIPTASLHSFAIAADRAPVRRFRQSLLHRREPTVAVFRIVRPGDTAIRQIRIFAEPVLAGDEVVGLRGAFQDVSAHYHTQVALAATQDQLADSEQRAEQEQELALRLQRAIMPEDETPVEAAGVDVAVRYRPADQGQLVAGDWYDALLLPDKQLLLVVGDITGHGIDAVTGMIAARNALRGLAVTGAGPAELLWHLNHAACYLTEGIAGTVVCGRYDPETRVLRWARAGHLPPVLVRDGAAEMLPLPGGVLLGLDPDAEYEEAVLPMHSGDTLLLYTDGLIERRADSISDALREFTSASVPAGRNAAAHADRILSSAISDTGDDACLVAVRIL
jgi:serine phosphatase RsbU (regulator of sigma subunit)